MDGKEVQVATIFSRPLDQMHALLRGQSYWGILLADNKWLTEWDTLVDERKNLTTLDGQPVEWARNLQWYDDVVATNTLCHIKEIWLFCPRTPTLPLGATARLEIDHLNTPYTAFQMKGATLDWGPSGRRPSWQMIGRVDDMATGACSYYAFDYLDGKLYQGTNNILGMKPWREGGSRIGLINLDVIGLSHFAAGIKRRGNMHYVPGLAEVALDGAILPEE